MIRGLYSAVSGMISLEAKQQVITNNIANAQTNGYKEDNLINKDFKEVMMFNHDKQINGKAVRNNLGTLSGGTRIDEIYTNFSQGISKQTDKDTDFCIDGEGFFTLQDDNGNKFYSRDGSFHVNKDGYLVNNIGYFVVGEDIDGNESLIKVDNSKIQCDDFGNINLNGVNKYKFKIANFNYNQIKKQGDNLYISTVEPETNNDAYIKQGYVESSNVNVIDEMVDMMKTMRQFQSNQVVIQSIDDSLKKLIENVGSVR